MTTNYWIDIEAPTLETANASAKAVLERAKRCGARHKRRHLIGLNPAIEAEGAA